MSEVGGRVPMLLAFARFSPKAGVNLTAVLRSDLAHIDEPSATEAVAQIDLCVPGAAGGCCI